MGPTISSKQDHYNANSIYVKIDAIIPPGGQLPFTRLHRVGDYKGSRADHSAPAPILPAPFGHIFLRLTHCQGLDKDSHKDSYRSDSGVKAAVRV
jgi:hypothetical protein